MGRVAQPCSLCLLTVSSIVSYLPFSAVKVKSLSCVQLFATPWTVDYHTPGIFHGIFQARVLEWVAISCSRGSSRPRDRTWVSCIVGRCFTIWATREVSAVATFNQLFSSVVSQDSNIYNHRGTCKKCKFLSPIWDLQNQKSWAWNPEICIQTRSCPSDSCAHWSLRIIGLKFKSYFINTWRTLGYALYLGEQLTGTQHHFLTLAHL